MGRNNKDLIKVLSITSKDCIFQTFTVGGPGGGGKDTSSTGTRWIHESSGAVGEGREERSQSANKRKAWERLGRHPKMEAWIKIQVAMRSGKLPELTPEEIYRKVDQMIIDGIKDGSILIEEF